jgi:hypothetical protein
VALVPNELRKPVGQVPDLPRAPQGTARIAPLKATEAPDQKAAVGNAAKAADPASEAVDAPLTAPLTSNSKN